MTDSAPLALTGQLGFLLGKSNAYDEFHELIKVNLLPRCPAARSHHQLSTAFASPPAAAAARRGLPV